MYIEKLIFEESIPVAQLEKPGEFLGPVTFSRGSFIPFKIRKSMSSIF